MAAVTRREEASAKYQLFFDSYRLRLRNLLHDGHLTARGRELPEKVGVDEAREIDLPVDSGFDSIPREFWASANVDWIANCAQGRGATYKFIQVLTADLFKAFPLPDPRPASDVLQMGDNFVFSGELREAEPLPVVGRPPYPWEEFHVEVAKRVKEGTLWEKQDAFINDMQGWCRNRWGREVGISTLKQKIKPYYDAFVWQKKSENDL